MRGPKISDPRLGSSVKTQQFIQCNHPSLSGWQSLFKPVQRPSRAPKALGLLILIPGVESCGREPSEFPVFQSKMRTAASVQGYLAASNAATEKIELHIRMLREK